MKKWARDQYAGMKPKLRADKCGKCGKCEPKCPQKIKIMERLRMVQGLFA